MDKKIDEILEFWFGHGLEILDHQHKSVYFQELWDSVWFAGIKEEQVDTEIKKKFEKDLQDAINGKHKKWEETSSGSLALIILLDQFSRNIYRNTKNAFEQDKEARRICKQVIERGLDKEVVPIGRVFLYLPLLHSEELEDQKKSVELFRQLKDENKSIAVIFDRFCTLAEKKKEEIEKYGRFPKRNHILKRKCSQQEDEDYFLQFQ
eukprot:gene2948-4958_t